MNKYDWTKRTLNTFFPLDKGLLKPSPSILIGSHSSLLSEFGYNSYKELIG